MSPCACSTGGTYFLAKIRSAFCTEAVDFSNSSSWVCACPAKCNGWNLSTTTRTQYKRNSMKLLARRSGPVRLPMPLAGGSFQLRFPVASGISANSGNLRCSFVTFTANPSWKEIQDELLKDTKGETMQHWRNHPDLVARVFYLKNKAMLEDFKSGKFGRYRGHVQVRDMFSATLRFSTNDGFR